MFCALFKLSNNAILGKNVIFRLFCLPQVMHEQSVEN